MKKPFTTPIAFIIFNRPDTTQCVFNEIKNIQPKQFYVISDGGRNEKEKKLVKQSRKIIEQINWDCKIYKNYSNKNLGVKKRISSGLDWFFENVEEGIILEDDCLPHQSFFKYCEELLKKYKTDERIMSISGDNFQNGKKRGNGSYYFSNYFHCWGWATWRRSWKKFDVEMKSYPKFKEKNQIKNIFKQEKVQNYWIKTFDNVHNNKVDSWAKIFTYTTFLNNGLSCLPNINLVSNIGFDQRAVHTKNSKDKFSNILKQKIQFPLKNPSVIKANKKADNYTSKNVFNIKVKNTIMQKLKNFLKKIGIFNVTKKIYLKLINTPERKIKKLAQLKEKTWLESYQYLSKIINENDFKVGAEIGIAFGGHIETILKNTKIKKIYGIDPHKHIDGYKDSMNFPQKDFDVLNEFVLNRLKKFGNKFENIRKFSKNAKGSIKEDLDFIYIDGDHSYNGVKQDLETWYSKIKKGGIVSGHDYGHPSHQGVKLAVDEFFNKMNLKVNTENNGVWWIKKY